MITLYFIAILLLFCLAIFDLSVGVSNDAVNFLNSSIGSKAFSLKKIMIIASVGIFVGAAFSGGMMDIARHGIFQPQYFHFDEIMAILMGVMLTDVILLDVFNSLGLPTSTTVSLVFELLGGTVALSILKIARSAGDLTFGMLINTEKALSVIIGIFVSVAIAFTFGVLVQYVARLLFTFGYRAREKYFIALFGGVGLSSVIYFILFKGLKGSVLMTPAIDRFVSSHSISVLVACFVCSAILSEILYLLRFNVLKLIVACGTFSLALAFAGNDLVNFIGVPLAGLSAYGAYAASGARPDEFFMTALQSSEKGQWWIVLLAGAVMVIVLWRSKKAQYVIRTSVALSRQDDADEVFGSNPMARAIVRASRSTAETALKILPESLKRWVNSRFDDTKLELEADDAAFDLIRASVNLVLASLLIALGTSLKLPLSTTYVTFMVAMGSSLADRAWGRESAVYRITGVLSVVGGWFITAFAAFISCFAVCLVLYFGGMAAAVILFALVVYLLVRSMRAFNKKELEKDEAGARYQAIVRATETTDALPLVRDYTRSEWGWLLIWTEDRYREIVNGFIDEDLSILRSNNRKIDLEKNHVKRLLRQGTVCSRKMGGRDSAVQGFFLYQANDDAGDIVFTMDHICDTCLQHIDNAFAPLDEEKRKQLAELSRSVTDLVEDCGRIVLREDFDRLDSVVASGKALSESIRAARKRDLLAEASSKGNARADVVYLTILYESKAIVDSALGLVKANHKFMRNIPETEESV